MDTAPTMASRSPLFLSRPGGRIAYEVSGAGPLVVCIPGMGELRSSYRFLSPRLVAADLRVACMDLRGHGDSDTTFDAYDDVAAGTDVLALIDHLGGPAVVVGNSMGAGAAAWAAAEAPERVKGLVLIAPFVRNTPHGPLAKLAFRLALVRPWGYAAWKGYYASLFPGRRPPDFDEHLRLIDRSLRLPGHWQAFVATTHTSHAPVEARLAEIRAPALVIMGAADPDFPDPAAEAELVAEHLSGEGRHAEVVMIAGAGHYPQAEFPEVTCPPIVEFAERVFGLPA